MLVHLALAAVARFAHLSDAGRTASRSMRRRTARAAWKPHMPCTPPPGGVDEEQRKKRGFGVV
jgi:hypothetical protein